MAKKESTFFNMTATLLVVTFLSSAALGFVYEITKEPIAGAKLEKKKAAISEVVPVFDNNPIDEKSEIDFNGGKITFYPAKKEEQLVGTAVETFTNQGFAGMIKLMVGLLPDGTISDIAVIEHLETPGLGNKIEKSKSSFSEQFKGKQPMEFILAVKKDGGDVDAITAATISSRAYCDAVKRAFAAYQDQNPEQRKIVPCQK